ncbi:nitrogen fixation protein NifZ [Derxia gummosa]|uniref:Nitrogen fixation protein NifZ n=1 Tax=Derxia gummosa DSM 723 TaxID=1121388 RepID=A0A8B6X283_9BURK|nr:nitrogen fixation protein NifZ [Derxia gummosa]
MIEPRDAKYQWGMRVVALDDLVNDGSFPDAPVDAVLARAGDIGEIVQVGHHVEANIPVYLVEFNGLVVGCLEEEIAVPERGLVPAA